MAGPRSEEGEGSPGAGGLVPGFPRRGRLSPPGILALALLAIALCAALSGCGIEEYLYFYPPVVDSALSVTPLSFDHNANNDSQWFLGYDMYYILIDADNTTFLNSISSKVDAYLSSKTPSELISILEGLGFVRPVAFSGDSALEDSPLFPISSAYSGEDISFTIPLGNLSTVKVSSTSSASGIDSYVDNYEITSIRRNSKNTSTGYYRTFANLSADDVDDGGDTAYLSTKPDTVIFRAYIFAMGITDSFSSVYSKPVRIGDADEPELTGDYE